MPCQDYDYKRLENAGLKRFIEDIKTNRKELSKEDITKLENILEKLDNNKETSLFELSKQACSILEDAEETSKRSLSSTDKGLLIGAVAATTAAAVAAFKFLTRKRKDLEKAKKSGDKKQEDIARAELTDATEKLKEAETKLVEAHITPKEDEKSQQGTIGTEGRTKKFLALQSLRTAKNLPKSFKDYLMSLRPHPQKTLGGKRRMASKKRRGTKSRK
jgi:hypothetical protein